MGLAKFYYLHLVVLRPNFLLFGHLYAWPRHRIENSVSFYLDHHLYIKFYSSTHTASAINGALATGKKAADNPQMVVATVTTTTLLIYVLGHVKQRS